MRVLITDDSKAMRMIVLRSLRQTGLDIDETMEAADGQEGLAAVTSFRPDLILSDWNMPNMTGIEALKKIKADAALKAVPVIMVTSESEKTKIIEAIQAGAANYIVKPFQSEVLQEKISAVLK